MPRELEYRAYTDHGPEFMAMHSRVHGTNRCDTCAEVPPRFYLASYMKGYAAPNRFICGNCLVGTLKACKEAGLRTDVFEGLCISAWGPHLPYGRSPIPASHFIGGR